MIPKLGQHLKETETTKVIVCEQPFQICVIEPSGAEATAASTRETLITDVSAVLVDLERHNRALSFEGPDWVRAELRKVGFANL